LCDPSDLSRNLKESRLLEFIKRWIDDHTTPSSNTKNTVKVVEDGATSHHVIHWRTETISDLFHRCKIEAASKLGLVFNRSYFHNCIPSYVRSKKRQDGLCPIHHTGLGLEKEFLRKRALWHSKCECRCAFCSPDDCNHGKSPDGGKCSLFTCNRCKEVQCPLEWSATRTSWLRPIQKKREGGGVTWTNEQYLGTRNDMSITIKREMDIFVAHSEHVIYHKSQARTLLEGLTDDEIIIKCDFIQNIVHSRGRETSASFYGKRQTQFLSFVVWYFAPVGGVLMKQKIFVDYLSSYLKHNSLFFQKCLAHLLAYIRDDVGADFKKV
jgi:hypothetical protein